jgi:hypothetical protein
MEPIEDEVMNALNDVALVFGRLENDLMWAVMKQMYHIRVRLLRELKGLPPLDWYNAPEAGCPPHLHPAVEEFIKRK